MNLDFNFRHSALPLTAGRFLAPSVALMPLVALLTVFVSSGYGQQASAAPLAVKAATQSKTNSKAAGKSDSRAAVNSIDPAVIDPVRQLQQISASVKASRVELSSIAAELDKVNHELDKFEGKPAKDIDRKEFARLGDRFNNTLARSAAVEKKVSQSLAKSLKDIESVRAALKRIQSERLTDKNTRHVLSDAELKECLKDLADLDKTVKELQISLKDPEK